MIAILATISIVSFNGIQTRANNTKTITATKEYVKAYSYYATDKGSYPNVAGCLGEVNPTTGSCLSQSGIAECFGIGSSATQLVNDALKPYMNNRIPSMSGQKIPCGNTTYVSGYAYFSTTSNSPVLLMLLRGDQACPSMSPNVESKNKSYLDDMTTCRYVLSNADLL